MKIIRQNERQNEFLDILMKFLWEYDRQSDEPGSLLQRALCVSKLWFERAIKVKWESMPLGYSHWFGNDAGDTYDAWANIRCEERVSLYADCVRNLYIHLLSPDEYPGSYISGLEFYHLRCLKILNKVDYIFDSRDQEEAEDNRQMALEYIQGKLKSFSYIGIRGTNSPAKDILNRLKKCSLLKKIELIFPFPLDGKNAITSTDMRSLLGHCQSLKSIYLHPYDIEPESLHRLISNELLDCLARYHGLEELMLVVPLSHKSIERIFAKTDHPFKNMRALGFVVDSASMPLLEKNIHSVTGLTLLNIDIIYREPVDITPLIRSLQLANVPELYIGPGWSWKRWQFE